jgi:hypothetical protein
MGWARFDDAYSDHPKIALAGIHAELLDIRAILYACRFETDGKIPRAVLPIVGRGIPSTTKQAKKLVEVGRWIAIDDGWEIVDFLEYNPSRASRDADRAAARDRMARSRGQRGSPRSSHEQDQNNGRSSPEVRLTPSRPVPDNHSSGTVSTTPVENVTDEEVQQIERSVLERIADSRLDAASGVTNRTRYRAKILAQLPDELDLPRLRRIIEHHPEAPIEMYADAALGNPTPYLKDYRIEQTETTNA